MEEKSRVGCAEIQMLLLCISFFSAAQVSPLSIRSRLLIDKVCRRKVFAREGNGGINVMSL